jgi:hypothetical protein
MDARAGTPGNATRREHHSTPCSIESDFRDMATHPAEGRGAPIHFEDLIEDDKIVACMFASFYFAAENIPHELPTH